LLLLAQEAGLEALEMACELSLETGIVTAAIVINELRRLIEPSRQRPAIAVADNILLQQEPAANCARYDNLRVSPYVH